MDSTKKSNKIIAGIFMGLFAMGLFAIATIACIIAITYTTFYPMYSVGQCVADREDREEWQTDTTTVFKVLQVGKSNYRLTYVNPKNMRGYTSERSFSTLNRLYSLTTCPGE